MAYTIPFAFNQFLERITVTPIQADASEARRADIVKILEANLTVIDSFPTGSLANGTAVTGFADLDIMVVLHYGKHIKDKKPSEVLQLVRDLLSEYKNQVRKNGQAVTLYYKTWPNVDIVPVARVTNDDGSTSHYEVPDMNTESWLDSRPRRHASNIAGRVSLCGEGFRNIVRMAKWWNEQHSSYLTSYHIEAMALQAVNWDTGDYPWDMCRFFEKAHDLIGSSLWYEGAYADSYLTSNARHEAKKRLNTAKSKSLTAWYNTYGTNLDHKSAMSTWREIFGDKFPAYG